MKNRKGGKLLQAGVALLVSVALCAGIGLKPITEAKAVAVVDDLLVLGIVGSLLAAVGVTFATSEDMQQGAALAYMKGSDEFRTLVNGLKATTVLGSSIAIAPTALLSALKSNMQVFSPDKTTVEVSPIQGKMKMDGRVLLSGVYPIGAGSSSATTCLIFRHPTKGFVFQSLEFVNCLGPDGSLWLQSTLNGKIIQTTFKTSGVPVVTNLEISSPQAGWPLKITFTGYDNNKAVTGVMWFSDAHFADFFGPVDAVEFVGVTTGTFHDFWGKDWTGTNTPSISAYPTVGYTADKNISADGLIAAAVQEYIRTHTDAKAIDIATYPDLDDYVGVNWRDVILSLEWKRAANDAFDGGDFGGGGASRPFPEIDDPGGGTDPDNPGGGTDPDNPGGGTDPDNPDNPGGGEIMLPEWDDLELSEQIATKFPFSIPWDIKRGFDLLCAEPIPPKWEIPFKIDGLIDESVELDLTRFSGIIEIFRFFEALAFTLGLAVLTRRVIKW